MRKWLSTVAVAAALMLAPLAEAGFRWQWTVTTTAGSPTTGTSPSGAPCTKVPGSATGLYLVGCKTIYVCSVITGGNHSGAGEAQAYFYDDSLADYAREGDADLAYTSDDASQSKKCWTIQNVVAGNGCGYWVPSGVTHTGTAVTLSAKCID